MCSKLTVFHNAKTAIAYLKTHRYQLELLPDVILLDINMPVMNGWQFLEEFSQINSDFLSRIRIYMLSSSISSQDARQAQACELLSGYMSKPITLPQLQEIFQP
ncbi:MAG: response regulator [Bacteroidetes bacterium]|nr:MAG: response regulator [Bacteroidota bacterium]